MEDISLIEKLRALMKMITSSPLFLFCSMMGVALLIYYIINIKSEKSINKWVFLGVWIVLAIALVINYNNVMLNLLDNLFDSFFMALYFPNLTIYIIIIVIINSFFFYSVFSKKIDRPSKLLNFVIALIIDILLILIIDTVNYSDISVYEELTVYSNSQLLILLELTSAIFTSWILLSLLFSAHRKLKKYDKKQYPDMPEIIFDEIE